MRSARPTANYLIFFFLTGFLLLVSATSAQENSPYSRYGLGDLIPSQNIMNRAMGGISAAFADYQTVNFSNPASYSQFKITTLDIGLDYNSRSLRALNPPRKFNSAYLIPSYLQMGIPLSKKKNAGMNFGLRPMTRINYNIIDRKRIPGIDSLVNNYIGNGGTYLASTGFGFGTKTLSIGFNAGYLFGNKEYNTRVSFINDSVAYKNTNSTDTTRYGGLFADAGIQYRIKLGEKTFLRLGIQGNLQSRLSASKDISRSTVQYDQNVGLRVIDSVFESKNETGTIIYPSSWKAGFMIGSEDSWQFGAELGVANWQNFRYYGKADDLAKSWTARIGGQIIPDFKSSGYWKRVAYRMGVSFGPDMIRINRKVPLTVFSFGTALPVRRNLYSNQYTTINTSFELGFRGNKSNDIRENIFRFALGLNLSDIWFNKPKYQ